MNDKPEISLRQKLMAKAGVKADAPEANHTILEAKEENKMATATNSVPWVEARKHPEIVKKVQEYKVKLADTIEEWGQSIGIDDLTLQHIMTLAKNPDAEVLHYWNPDKKVWFRYRQGDEVPRWLQSLTNRNDYKYPKGSELTADMLAKFKGRGGGKKLYSLD